MTVLVNPVRGCAYTTKQVLETLFLKDSPSLCFFKDGQMSVIQTSHLDEEELLSVPGMAALQWRYIRTTFEWIPVFQAVSDADVLACVDTEPSVDPYAEPVEIPSFWVTPKGFPREQYYSRLPDGTIVETHTLAV